MKTKIYNKKKLTYSDKLIGKVFDTKNSGKVEVIAKIDHKYCKRNHSRYVIKFLNTGYISDYEKYDIMHSKIKDPYSVTVVGIGFLGSINKSDIVDKNLYDKLYSVWKNMISRCYYKKHSKYCSYGGKGIYVSKRWHNFTNFFNDAQKLCGYDRDLVVNSELQLDKDLLSGGSKKYSRKTCSWLSRKDNNSLVDRTNSVLSIPIIVYHPNGDITEERSINSCSTKYDLDRSCISDCLKGISKQHKGYKFKYNVKK